MIVPEGAQPGQQLRCMLVPPGVLPGNDVLITTPDGQMSVTIPQGMRPGEVLVVDMGTELRQWVAPTTSQGCCASFCARFAGCASGAFPFIACLALILLAFALITAMPHRPHPYGGYGGGYGYGQHPSVTAYKE